MEAEIVTFKDALIILFVSVFIAIFLMNIALSLWCLFLRFRGLIVDPPSIEGKKDFNYFFTWGENGYLKHLAYALLIAIVYYIASSIFPAVSLSSFFALW